jgi:hypothetical protein
VTAATRVVTDGEQLAAASLDRVLQDIQSSVDGSSCPNNSNGCRCLRQRDWRVPVLALMSGWSVR